MVYEVNQYKVKALSSTSVMDSITLPHLVDPLLETSWRVAFKGGT
jgi:hypothetical protein